jgi:hypothetical protein
LGSTLAGRCAIASRVEGGRRDDTRNYAVGGLDHGQEQNRQPVKFAPNEARWHDEQPADAVLLACRGERPERKPTTAVVRGETLTAAALPAGRSGRPEPTVGYFPEARRPPLRTARQGMDSAGAQVGSKWDIVIALATFASGFVLQPAGTSTIVSPLWSVVLTRRLGREALP